MNKPEVLMLCGLTGSGKSTYAKKLISEGYVKLSIDESMYSEYGVADIDYPGEKYVELEKEVKNKLNSRLKELLMAGASVILDYGFWKREERDECKRMVQANGGSWKLFYFKASPTILAKRLRLRNTQSDANSFFVTHAMLDDFIGRFEAPCDEGEQVITQK